jgi:hypothetical protein
VTRRVALVMATLAIATLGIGLACGSERIVVATLVASDASIKCELSDAGDAGNPCGAGSFCSRITCGMNDGLCVPLGTTDGCATPGPECGCDGITYYNRCVRQAAGMSLAGTGECVYQMGVQPTDCYPSSQFPTGVSGKDCPPKTYCAAVSPFPFLPNELGDADTTFEVRCEETKQMVLGQLGALSGGLCWALPDSRPDAGSRLVQSPCESACIDDWSAIRDGGAYFACPSDASAF